ncbi:MAG: GxxExxY protein [Phycisphaerales bacterium]|nr:GxxExxY protein [Phycisphaerales bacterium]
MLSKEGQDPLTGAIIGAAIEVHKTLGPGLLESVYEDCLAVEFNERGFRFRRQLEIPVVYKGRPTDGLYRVDMLVEEQVVLELKAVEKTPPIHEAQLLTYLRVMEKRVGLLINCHTPYLRDSIVRRVL